MSKKKFQVVKKHIVINIGPLLHKAEIFNDEAKPQVASYNIKAKLSLFFFLPWETFIVVGREVGVGKYERCVLLCISFRLTALLAQRKRQLIILIRVYILVLPVGECVMNYQ